jgi:hypothetical protein
MSNQRVYNVSVNRYRIDYTDEEGNPKVLRKWGTEGGIIEFIEENGFENATYKVAKLGIVQKGKPVHINEFDTGNGLKIAYEDEEEDDDELNN